MSCSNCNKSSCNCSDNCPTKVSDITTFDCNSLNTIEVPCDASLCDVLGLLEAYTTNMVNELDNMTSVELSSGNCIGLSPGNYSIQQVVDAISQKLCDSFIYEIGEYVPSQGGVVFHRYMDGNTQKYLIVSINYQSFSQAWSNITNVSVGSGAQSTWNGLSNSDAIVAQPGETISAAALCLNLISGGKSDWYLPSVHELILLYNNSFSLNRTLSGNSSYGSIAGAEEIYLVEHWSSTENQATRAWALFYGAAFSYVLTVADKADTCFVRAIRSYSFTY